MTNKPVELRPEDLIKRPETLPAITTGPATQKETKPIDQAKEVMKDMLEFKKMAEELGLKLPGLPGKSNESGEPAQETGPNQGDQLKMAVQLLRVKYGDVTVKVLIEKLLTEYGNRKLSSF